MTRENLRIFSVLKIAIETGNSNFFNYSENLSQLSILYDWSGLQK